MHKLYCRILLLSCFTLTLMIAPALAFEILLDIDKDNDPATINVATEDTSAVVKVVLSPTTPGETIGFVAFGLGGQCLECSGVQTYGTSFDLPVAGPWVTAPGFDSEAAYATYLGCAGNPGYHLLLSFWPQGGGSVILDQPIFLASFNAWLSDPVPGGCTQPSSYLVAMPGQGEWWSYVLLSGAQAPTATEVTTWGKIKSIYR